MRTFSPKAADITRQWWVVDAQDMVLGRLCTEVASRLRGKHKATFAPNMDMGDHVIVVNADKVTMTSNKADKNFYYRHTGYPGGIRKKSFRALMEEEPDQMIHRAVKNMLPKGPLGRQMITKLKVYSGPTHPHTAQNPQPLELPQAKRVS